MSWLPLTAAQRQALRHLYKGESIRWTYDASPTSGGHLVTSVPSSIVKYTARTLDTLVTHGLVRDVGEGDDRGLKLWDYRLTEDGKKVAVFIMAYCPSV